jgi:hypothetical protein
LSQRAGRTNGAFQGKATVDFPILSQPSILKV